MRKILREHQEQNRVQKTTNIEKAIQWYSKLQLQEQMHRWTSYNRDVQNKNSSTISLCI